MEAIREKNEELISDDNDALVSKFMEDMMPTKLLCREPVQDNELWVFWSKEPIDSEHTSTNWGIQDRTRIVLSKFYSINQVQLLVQLWAPEMIGGRRHLTTTLQPFALRYLTNEKLNEYRKHCLGFKFLVADVENDDKDLILEDGIVGRVFRNQLPEYCPDLRKYSISEYPHRDLALSLGINSTVAFPLFKVEPSGLDYCVGVLELLATINYLDYFERYFKSFRKHLKGVGLRTIDMSEIQTQINGVYERGPIKEEIRAALGKVCKTYKFADAITWVRYDRSCNDSREGFQRELIVPSREMSIFHEIPKMEDYFCSASFTLRQGLAGKSFSSRNPYFSRDVSKLSMTVNPFDYWTGRFRSVACFAVCLRNISTGKHEFVIEFFQHRKNTFSDLVTLFSSILATMRQQLKTFVVVTDPENEMFIEVHELGESFVKPTTPDSSEGECTPAEDSLQSLRTAECTLNSTCRKPDQPPSYKRSKHVNELDHAIPESSFSVSESERERSYSLGNSECGSTKWEKRLGYMISANETHIPKLNQRRTESSHSDGPLSEASAVVAHNVPPCTPVSDVERMTIKVSYMEEDMIIKFNLPTLSSKADLEKEVITRMGDKLKDKAFDIKYLDDVSLEPSLLIATDTDWQECIGRTRSRGKKSIRTVIELQKDVQDLP